MPEIIDADLPRIFPGQVRMGPCPVKRGIYRFRRHRSAACEREEIWIPTAKNVLPRVILSGEGEHIIGHHNKAFFIVICVRDEDFSSLQIDVLRQEFTAFVGAQATGINQPKQHWGNFIQKGLLPGRRKEVDRDEKGGQVNVSKQICHRPAFEWSVFFRQNIRFLSKLHTDILRIAAWKQPAARCCSSQYNYH